MISKELPQKTLGEVLDMIPVSWFHYRLLIMCGLAFMADSMEVSLLSFISECAGDEWNLSSIQIANIASAGFAGQLIGSFAWGQFADKFGRRKAFLLACILISIFGLLSGYSPTYVWLIIFRSIVGFGIAGLIVPFDLLAEFLPLSHRGRFLIMIEYFWTIGGLFVTGIAWGTLSDRGWRMLTYLTAIPVIVTSIFSLMFLSESPRWLLMQGRHNDAKEILKNAAKMNGITISEYVLEDELSLAVGDSDFVEIEKNILKNQIEEKSLFEILKSPQMFKLSIKLAIVWSSFGFAYYGIVFFVSRLYSITDAADQCSFDYQSIFINASSEFVGVTIAALIIDRWGRSRTQGVLYLLGGIMMFGMGFKLTKTSVFAFSWITRMFAMGSSCTTWVATPELFPTEMRATGHSLCNSAGRIGGFLSSYFVFSSLSNFAIAIGLAIVNCIAAFVSFSLPDTSNLELDEVTKEVTKNEVQNDNLRYKHYQLENESLGQSILG